MSSSYLGLDLFHVDEDDKEIRARAQVIGDYLRDNVNLSTSGIVT